MTKLAKMVVSGAAVLVLASCAMYQDKAPSWMPGSGAVSVKLTGAEEVPPVTTTGSGSGSIRVAADGAVSGSVTTTGVPGTMAHLHQAARGKVAPPFLPLTKSGDTYTVPPGSKLTEAQMKAFKDGHIYVNVHSAKHPGGEVRGQLQP